MSVEYRDETICECQALRCAPVVCQWSGIQLHLKGRARSTGMQGLVLSDKICRFITFLRFIMKCRGRKRLKQAPQPWWESDATPAANKSACGNNLDCGHLQGLKHRDHCSNQTTDMILPTERLQGIVCGGLRRLNILEFTQIALLTAKATHLGWLSIVMAIELRRTNPREGEDSFPCYLYELYGMVLGGVATEINQGFGSELVLAMMILVFFEISLHKCPEPAIQHLRGLEALILARKTHFDRLPAIAQRLDGFAFEMVEVAKSTISARQEFHPKCPDHPQGLFTWNVCVDTRPQLVQLRCYVAGILEVVKEEALSAKADIVADKG